MISRRLIQLKDRTVLFSPDDPVPLADRIQALVKLRITDELTAAAVETPVTLRIREPGFVSRTASGGLTGLIGIPRQVFPALQTNDYILHLTISATRYLSRELQVNVPKDPAFPNGFTPLQLNIGLHREPVFIAGRTVRVVGNGTAPLGGAVVSVTGIWRTAPPANVAVAPDSPDIVSIEPPLYSDRAVPAGLRLRDLIPVLGNDKTITDEILPGADSIRLSNRLGLAVGDIVLIDAEDSSLSEFIAIKTVSSAAPAEQPTAVTLDHRAIRGHRRGALVRRVDLQPPGSNRQFTVDGLFSDSCVFLDDVSGLVAGQEVEISGGPAPVEHHRVMNFSVVSDADGYYRLPPLSRLAQLEIHAEKTVGAQTFQMTRTFRPDYRQRENQLDFMLAA
jgi:hypothetical protein